MKMRCVSLLLILFVAFTTPAQKGVQQNLRRHVEYLASEKLEGRRTGEKGATAAAGYIANNFAKFRLKPGVRSGNSKGFLQQFLYVSGVALAKENILRIVPAHPTRENKMEVGINWMPLGYSPNADIPASPVVFAGYGIRSAESNYNDYADLDVSDRIVLILDGTPDAANPHSSFGRFNIHTKALIAKEKGARAMLVIGGSENFREEPLARLAYSQSLGELALPAAVIARQHGAELLGAKNEMELAEIERKLALKSNGHSQAETQAVASVSPNQSGTKAVAALKVDLQKTQVEAYNVIGKLEGTDPALKNEAIVIGAHYDHLGRGGQGSLAVNSSDIHHGADDNASGTAAVLELARQFAKERNNKRTLIFMAFGGEEEGLLGSKHYVNNPVWPLEKTIAMINLDMVGRLNNRKLNVGGVGTSPELRALVEKANQTLLATATYSIAPVTAAVAPVETTSAGHQKFQLQLNEDGFGPSDHSSFYGKQIPVLFLFTGTHADYHRPSDTFEKINYEGLLMITDYVYGIVSGIDLDRKRPTYTQAKSSGVMGRSTGFNVSLGTVPSYADSTDGLVLDGVRENSPAAKAGIKPGDKILKLAGKDVRNVTDYTYILGELKAGQEYEVVLLRGSEKLTLRIIPAPAARR